MSGPLVVEATRSGFVESEHLVDVAVVDAGGTLVASAGDPARPAAFRSSAKPIQARVAIEAGWTPPDERAHAIACASHNGEPGHVEVVRSILVAAGVPEDALRCPEAVPFHPEDVMATDRPRRVVHNCSGNHAAMLAACAAAAWPLDDYRAPEHPLQRRVGTAMRALLDLEPRVLVDGCGVVTFVAPLAALARAFASVAGTAEAEAMRAHPWLVGGTGRFDTDLMRASELVVKSGAEGLSCVTGRGVTVALRPRDGAARARGPATLLVLEQLGLLDAGALDTDVLGALDHHRRTPVLGGGRPVGAVCARGALTRG